jgi:hypothetical protein
LQLSRAGFHENPARTRLSLPLAKHRHLRCARIDAIRSAMHWFHFLFARPYTLKKLV